MGDDRYCSCYYFHGQDLCMVPRHVREDVAWMADHGVDGVCVGVHDADLHGGNTNLVCDSIRAAGLDLWLIPSRLGGLMAGWHRGPSYLAVDHPDWWAVGEDGRPRRSYGPQLSVFHPAVPGAIAEVVGTMIERFGARGIVWDELKSLDGEDHSEAALAALGRPAANADLQRGTADCFSAINAALRQRSADLRIACFIYASCPASQIATCAGIVGLDEFGCDGKCWPPGICATGEGGDDKVLLGGHDARFRAVAAAHGQRSFTLLETQLLDAPALELSLTHLPDFLAEKTGHLSYYYYPYGMAEPERFMPRFGEAIATWRRG